MATLSLKDFLKRYGADSTTNFQLIQWAKELNIKPFYYVMYNEIDYLKRKYQTKPVVYVIANYQTTEERGSHHVALYKKGDTSYFFDSYGIQPDFKILDFLEEGTYSTFQIQPEGTKMCGQLSLYVLYKLSQGYDFYETILDLQEQVFRRNPASLQSKEEVLAATSGDYVTAKLRFGCPKNGH